MEPCLIVLRCIVFQPDMMSKKNLTFTLRVSFFSSLNYKYMNSSVFPQSFINHPNITNSSSVNIKVSSKFLYVIVFIGNRVLPKN